jgi:hypothetical protein
MALVDIVNGIFHIPVLADYLVYSFWFILLILAPFIGLGIVIYDHISGHIWT